MAIFAVLGMAAPALPTFAQPRHAPHENPATASAAPDNAALLLSYSQIVNLASGQHYQDARQALDELAYADVPGGLTATLDYYGQLYETIFTTLDSLDSRLGEVSAMLSLHRIATARAELDDAMRDVRNADTLLADIEAASASISEQLGVFAGPLNSRVGRAHARLEESLARLKGLVSEFDRLQQALRETYTEMARLTPTELSLSATGTPVFVGDSITVEGQLSGGGESLAGRELVVSLDDAPVAATVTGAGGRYAATVTVPYRYTGAVSLAAAYMPEGDDKDRYLAAQSPASTILPLSYGTTLEVTLPAAASPGLPFTVSGRVSSPDGEPVRGVRVLLDDTPLAEAATAGPFRLEVTVPPEAATGGHRLTVAVTPRGRYAGAEGSRELTVTRLPLKVDASLPGVTVLPWAVHVSGRVTQGPAPVAGAGVSLRLKDVTGHAVTAADGTFAATLEVPLRLSPLDYPRITMDVTPAEAWYAPARMERPSLTVNPLSTGLILAIALALGVLTYRRRPIPLPEGAPPPPEEEAVTVVPVITPAPRPGHRTTGIRGRILDAYRDALEAIEKATGIGMAPHVTLREFLDVPLEITPDATGRFAELTAITEVTLYATHPAREDTAARAEKLAAAIREELRHGAA